MTTDEAKKIFEPSFISQLDDLLINGNFGDIVMCPDALDIVSWFRNNNPDMKISISTNAGARSKDFWEILAELDCEIHFCLDGLEDTHSLYRRNTLFNTVISNAKTFINAGGKAYWKFIVFDHNRHQIDQARFLSQQMGFQDFLQIDSNRTQGPVFNHKKELVYYIGSAKSPTNFDSAINEFQGSRNLENLLPPTGRPINCQVKKEKSIYVNSIGEVYPCCWLGFNPKTFGKKSHFAVSNSQIKPFLERNNAKEYGLKNAMEWFHNVSTSWHKGTYGEGLLHICNYTCS